MQKIDKKSTSLIIFGIAALTFEFVIIFVYGFHVGFYQIVNPANLELRLLLLNLTILLILLGFGLLTTFIKHTSWSGLAYTLLITAIVFQLYFLINIFWTKVQVGYTSDSFLNKQKTNIEINADIAGLGREFENAFKAVIAVYVAYAAMHGKIGPLQIFWLSICGVIGYQLNRQILVRINTNDNGGSMGIFTFGSFTGLTASYLMNQKGTFNHQEFRSTKQNSTLALLGTLFLWCFFPVLNIVSLIPNTADSQKFSPFLPVVGINIWLALSASVISTFCTSILIHGKISAHDVIFGSFSGAIAFGSSSNLIYFPVAPLFVGFVAGIVSTLSLSYIRKPINKNWVIDSLGIVQTYMISGICGGIWAAIFTPFQADSHFLYQSAYISPIYNIKGSKYAQGGLQMAGLLISILVGQLTGVCIGLPFRFLSIYQPDDFFNDRNYFINENQFKQVSQNDSNQRQNIENIQNVQNSDNLMHSTITNPRPNINNA